jgi:hypothetical protein
LAKGYIAQQKPLNINWEKEVASIAREKACQVVVKKMKSSYLEKSGGEMSFKKLKVRLCPRAP